MKVLIANDWQHQRAERWLEQVQAAIVEKSGCDPAEWTGGAAYRIEVAQRYKTTAERAS